MLYLGINLGITCVKMILMQEDGNILNSLTRDYTINYPHKGWVEQRPQDWKQEVLLGLKELLPVDKADYLAGIGVSGQMHGLVILDKDDDVIRPAILNEDDRAIGETAYLNDVLGKKNLSEETANIAFPGFVAPQLLWLRKNEPENYSRISKIMLPKDYLLYELTGMFATDYSDASGMLLLDVKNKKWSDKMCEICGIYKTMLPKLYESSDVVGTLKPVIAKNLGLNHEIKVVAGAGDTAAAAVGTGTVGDGKCSISLENSGTVFVSSTRFGVDRENSLHSFCHADGNYHLLGYMPSAASCNKWWMEEVLNTKEYSKEQQTISALGNNHVFFLPDLLGERSPHNNPDATGTLIGLTIDSTRADITQAVLEGVAFALRDLFEIARKQGIAIDRTRIYGVGARSGLWRQIICNILNMKVERISCEEGSAFGAAILAAVGCKEYDSVGEASEKIVKVKSVESPDPVLVEKYETKYQQFRQIYPACKELFSKIK